MSLRAYVAILIILFGLLSFSYRSYTLPVSDYGFLLPETIVHMDNESFNVSILINESGYYTLDFDIMDSTYNVCVLINASDVVLDGQNHLVDGVYTGKSLFGIYVLNDV